MTLYVTHWLHNQLSVNVETFITLSTELTKYYVDFSHGMAT